MSSSVHTKIQREFAEVERELEEDGARGSPLFSGGIIDFCKGWLKLAPTQYQEKILLDASRFVVARWARQTGKSTTIAALSLYCALHEGAKRVIILAPSLRQSKKLIHRIGSFIPKNRSHILAGRRLKTRLEFVNGSSIEALPNSPETIRGETCDLIILDEAEFAEDEEAFFPLSLLTSCVSYELKTYDESIALAGEIPPSGSYFVGCDLGKKQDHSAVAVVEKKEGHVKLIHMKQFKLGTDYTHLMGYLNRLGQRLQTVKKTNIDQTGVGEYFIEEATKAGVKLAVGTTLTVPEKENVLFYLRHLMEEGRLHIAYDPELINEMNAERFQLTKTGQTQFSNPSGTHDDRLWALALAAYASRLDTPT